MSHVTFDLQWESAMAELKELINLENPTYPLLAPKTLADFSKLYVKYLQVYKKLEDCYEQNVHAQKRLDLRAALEACIGRLLEIKSWVVSLNDGDDLISLEDVLMDMNLGPESMDLIPPRFMVNDNASMIDARNKILSEIKESIQIVEVEYEKDDHKEEMSQDEAIEIIQANERGRQGRERITQLARMRQMQERELERQRAGLDPLSPEAAAIILQAGARGFLARSRVKQLAQEELNLLGMDDFLYDMERESIFARVKENIQRRKEMQMMNKANYDEALVFAREKVKELEGQEMREIIQEKINAWLNENRDPESGFYPEFPKPNEGGSKYILDPPPMIEFLETGKKEDKKKEEQKKNSSKAPLVKKFPMPIENEEVSPSCPSFFRKCIEKCLQEYSKTWHDKDDSSNLNQKYDPDFLKSALRPSIFEEVRLEVDQDTRVILQNIKKKLLAEAKALRKKTGSKDAKKEKKEKKDEKDMTKFYLLDLEKPIQKPPKDKTAQRTVESIFSELAENGIIQCCPARMFSEFIGADSFPGASQECLSLAQVRRLVIEYCVLPQASNYVNEYAPLIKSVLLYGGESNGKTLLVHCACQATGATYINLSPRSIEGKYPGKQATKMVEMAFKVAKIMAPSVIYIDEVELVFMKDKKKMKAYGLKDKPGRIKSSLMKQVAMIKPGDRVLIIGTSSKPQGLHACRWHAWTFGGCMRGHAS